MDDAPERLRERAQRDGAENPRQGEDESARAEVAQPAQAEATPGVATVTIAEPGVANVRAHRDLMDDGQMHD